jgi:hypothetical protein
VSVISRSVCAKVLNNKGGDICGDQRSECRKEEQIYAPHLCAIGQVEFINVLTLLPYYIYMLGPQITEMRHIQASQIAKHAHYRYRLKRLQGKPPVADSIDAYSCDSKVVLLHQFLCE